MYTTPPAAPDLQAELDATNRQVEILSDALAESRREVAALKAVQEPVAWIEHEWSGSGLRHLHFERREQSVRDEVMNPIWTPLYTTPPAQPAVQEPAFNPCSCRWKGEEQVQQCTLHAAHIEAIHEWAERAKAAEAKLKEKTNEQ